MAPNVFHIGVEERVSVTVFDAGQPVTVKLYLQDYPHRRKTFSEVQAVLPAQKGETNKITTLNHLLSIIVYRYGTLHSELTNQCMTILFLSFMCL